MDQNEIVTSPDLPTQDTLIRDAKHFSGTQTLDLTDDDIQAAWRIVQRIRHKYHEIFRRKFNDPTTIDMDIVFKWIDQFEDEVKTTLAEHVDVLATVNVMPILEGQPLEIHWIGKMPGSNLAKFGMDHEKKAWEVKRATALGESYLGESKD